MAVHWNAAKCEANIHAVENFEEDSKEWRDYACLREALIWGLVLVKFPPKSTWAITEGNWRDVFKRLRTYEAVSGSMRQTSEERFYFQPAEVQSMIGLEVNAGNQTEAQFSKHMAKIAAETAHYALQRYDREQAEAA